MSRLIYKNRPLPAVKAIYEVLFNITNMRPIEDKTVHVGDYVITKSGISHNTKNITISISHYYPELILYNRIIIWLVGNPVPYAVDFNDAHLQLRHLVESLVVSTFITPVCTIRNGSEIIKIVKKDPKLMWGKFDFHKYASTMTASVTDIRVFRIFRENKSQIMIAIKGYYFRINGEKIPETLRIKADEILPVMWLK